MTLSQDELDKQWDERAFLKNRQEVIAKFGEFPKEGDKVEDCRFQVRTIMEIQEDNDTVVLDDGANCSLIHCCDKPSSTAGQF